MTFETHAVTIVARLLRNLDNAYPDVGMGYSNSHWVERAAQLLKLQPSQYDAAQALKDMK